MMNPLGLYVHIPFCRRRCPYCDFAIHVGADELLRARYVSALKRELGDTLQEATRPVTSIYFGGGTPTALSTAQLSDLMKAIRDSCEVAPDVEITLEANPEDLSAQTLSGLRAAGFNRLSLGAQSLDDAVLRGLGRAHDAQSVGVAVHQARMQGWENVSFDLIFGLPLQSRESWRETLQRAGELAPQHVSAYSLTIEEGTPFHHRVQSGKMTPLSSDCEAELLNDAREVLGGFGLQRYEVSNYARAGCESRHNLNYWRGGDYFACGAGAHGHAAGHRWWNERGTLRYVELMEQNNSARIGDERLTPEQRLDERVLMGVRLREGVAWREAAKLLGVENARTQQIATRLQELCARGLTGEVGGVLSLPPEQVAVADAIAARLLV